MTLLKNTSRAFDESSPADSELLNRLQELQDKVKAPSTPSAEENAFFSDDESQVENNNEEPEMGVYDMAQAASFFEGNFGAKAFLNYNQLRAQELHGEYSRNNGGGAITVVNGIDEKEEKEKEELEKFKDSWGEQAWDKAQIDVGGITMSGEDWDQAYEVLSDPKRRAQLQEALMRKKGWDADRAKKATDDALRLAQIAQKIKDGTATAADREEANTITANNPDAAEAATAAADKDFSNGPATPSKKASIANELPVRTVEKSHAIQQGDDTNIVIDVAAASQPIEEAKAVKTPDVLKAESSQNRMTDIILTSNFNPLASAQVPTAAPQQVAVNTTPQYDMNLGLS